jgi:hypothetical protein
MFSPWVRSFLVDGLGSWVEIRVTMYPMERFLQHAIVSSRIQQDEREVDVVLFDTEVIELEMQ